MEKRQTTKEKIMEAALTLFSERGYDGVGVDEIAETAGVKGPALYHYFKGKEALLQETMEGVGAHYFENFGTFQNTDACPKSMEELFELTYSKVSFTLHDPQVKKIRKLIILEQFRNQQMKDLASRHFIFGLQELYKIIFTRMMDAGIMQRDDAGMLAIEFTSPITLWVHLIDREPDREAEMMELMKKHMEHFAAVYALPEHME